jgi:hypothetical protein
VSAEKSKSTEGFFAAALLFFLLLFSRQPQTMPNSWQPLFMPAISSSDITYTILSCVNRVAVVVFLFYFGLIYSWCVLLLSLLKLIKGREKSKEFFNPVGKQQTKEKPFTIIIELGMKDSLNHSTNDESLRNVKLHFVRPCATHITERVSVMRPLMMMDFKQKSRPANQLLLRSCVTDPLFAAALPSRYYIVESGWGWPAGRWHVYSSSFRDATQSSRAVCPSSISLPQIIASINPDGLWQHCWTPGKIKETTTTWDMVCASLPSTASLKAQYMQMRVD